MNTVETIHRKVLHLPPQAQEEVLDAIEDIEERYRSTSDIAGDPAPHILDRLAEISIDGPPDLSSDHHRYARGRVEESD